MKVKVGIVGCGVIGHIYISVDVQVVGYHGLSALHIENARMPKGMVFPSL